MNKLIIVLSLCLVCVLFLPFAEAENYIIDVFNPEVDSIFYRDVGIVDFRPDTVNAGEPLVAEADVWNYGEITETFGILLEYSDSTYYYSDTKTVTGLPPFCGITVGFDNWIAPVETGYFAVKCTLLVNDSNPSNNGGIYLIYVRPSQSIKEMDIPIVANHTNELNTRIMTITQFKSQLLKPKSRLEIYIPNGNRITPERINPGIYFIKTDQIRKIVIIK
jgi:hypothetical protein